MAQDASRDGRELSGVERAAAILLAMGKPPAGRVLRHLAPAELRAVTRAAAELGSVPMAALERLVEDFSSDFSRGANLLGDAGQARELLNEALPPDQVHDILTQALGEAAQEDVWAAVAAAPGEALAAFLKSERPPTAAYVLSKVDPMHAAKVVGLLARESRNAVLCGMVAPAPIAPRAASLVEAAVRHSFLKAASAPAGGDGRARVAAIINSLEAGDAEDAMQAIGDARPKDAALLKSLLFTFNDLPKLSERARALLFDKAPTDVVVLALRGTDTEFRTVVLSSLPARARRLVEGELATASNAPPRDIAKARKSLADIVLGMAQRGEIELRPSDAPEAA